LDALSSAEWSYLLGLFLADGYSDTNPRIQLYRVRFLLQGDEGDIASRVVGLLRRVGCNPRVERQKGKDMLVVRVYSKVLLSFLPDKKTLRGGAASERFLLERRLHDPANALPFCAGLMDGDGTCRARPCRSRARVRQPCPGRFEVYWRFTQTKLPFLRRFFEGFVESLAPGSTGRSYRNGRWEDVRVNEAGREALRRAGFELWSLKAAESFQQVSRLRAEQTRLREAAGWRRHS
jgi:hypothetical protein